MVDYRVIDINRDRVASFPYELDKTLEAMNGYRTFKNSAAGEILTLTQRVSITKLSKPQSNEATLVMWHKPIHSGKYIEGGVCPDTKILYSQVLKGIEKESFAKGKTGLLIVDHFWQKYNNHSGVLERPITKFHHGIGSANKHLMLVNDQVNVVPIVPSLDMGGISLPSTVLKFLSYFDAAIREVKPEATPSYPLSEALELLNEPYSDEAGSRIEKLVDQMEDRLNKSIVDTMLKQIVEGTMTEEALRYRGTPLDLTKKLLDKLEQGMQKHVDSSFNLADYRDSNNNNLLHFVHNTELALWLMEEKNLKATVINDDNNTPLDIVSATPGTVYDDKNVLEKILSTN